MVVDGGMQCGALVMKNIGQCRGQQSIICCLMIHGVRWNGRREKNGVVDEECNVTCHFM